jgi:hypothetical protein
MSLLLGALSRGTRPEQENDGPNQYHRENSRYEPCHCHTQQNSFAGLHWQEVSTF